MIKVYLACPYTHRDPLVMEMRFRAVTAVAAKILSTGKYNVFSPITHSHPFTKHGLMGTWDFWKQVDTQFIEWSDQLWVLTIPGWRTSTGVTAEIPIARERGKRIRYVNKDARFVRVL